MDCARPAQAISSVMIGTGASSRMFGQENQRRAMSGSITGVQMLTSNTAAHTPRKDNRPCWRAQACRPPSVFSTSQPAPSSA